MTGRTNPLANAAPSVAGKATVEDLHRVVAELNVNPDVQRAGWHFHVVPNEQGKMCIRRLDADGPSAAPRCTPEQARQVLRSFVMPNLAQRSPQ